jgi:uncharacterized protein YjiS (DUF1127 family)
MSNTATMSVSLSGPTGGLTGTVRSLLAYVAQRLDRQRVTEHLSSLDDRLLADMGLARGDIGALFR